MPSLRDIRTRIGSVKSTRQITSAMKMVAAAKLRRATENATRARPYQQTLTATLQRVAAGAAGEADSPLLVARPVIKTVALVVVGTDRGLCGGFNGNLGRKVETWLHEKKAAGVTVVIHTYGKKPRDFLKARGHIAATTTTDVTVAKYAATVQALSDKLTGAFIGGEVDECWIAFNQFKSTLTQVPTFQRVLPVTLEAGEAQVGGDILYEPDAPRIIGALLPLQLRTQLRQTFLENEAGEHAARMTAMDTATRNASDLIDGLTLTYNRGRQAAITKELIEIVSGAEAL